MRDGRVKIKIIRMRKTRERGRFLVEAIGRVIANCRPVRVMTERLRERLARMEIGRLRAICLVFIAGMLLCDVVLLFQGGGRTRAAPTYYCHSAGDDRGYGTTAAAGKGVRGGLG